MSTDNPLVETVMLTDCFHICHASGKIIGADFAGSSATSLFEANDLSDVINHRRNWPEVVTASGATIAEQNGKTVPLRMSPDLCAM